MSRNWISFQDRGMFTWLLLFVREFLWYVVCYWIRTTTTCSARLSVAPAAVEFAVITVYWYIRMSAAAWYFCCVRTYAVCFVSKNNRGFFETCSTRYCRNLQLLTKQSLTYWVVSNWLRDIGKMLPRLLYSLCCLYICISFCTLGLLCVCCFPAIVCCYW